MHLIALIVLRRKLLDTASSDDERGIAHHGLGLALWRLGERERGTQRLDEAVAAFREALKEQTHGPRYSLGDIGIAQRKRMFIQPETEARIELLFDDAAGMQHSELAVGHVERG